MANPAMGKPVRGNQVHGQPRWLGWGWGVDDSPNPPGRPPGQPCDAAGGQLASRCRRPRPPVKSSPAAAVSAQAGVAVRGTAVACRRALAGVLALPVGLAGTRCWSVIPLTTAVVTLPVGRSQATHDQPRRLAAHGAGAPELLRLGRAGWEEYR